jgi:hypothetical protein
MAASVKMAERDKHRHDRLPGEIMARQGRRASPQNLLSWLLDLGEVEKARFSQDVFRPMTGRENSAVLHLSVSTGTRTREEEIDRVIAKAAR